MDIGLGLAGHPAEELGAATLVHGRPTLTVPPRQKYGHAWLEFGDHWCYDAERDMIIPKALFYSAGQIEEAECERYDWTRFKARMDSHEHWGPWDGPEACPPSVTKD